MALPSSRFTGVASPTFSAHFTSSSTPSAAAILMVGMFIEWTSASRSVTSPLNDAPQFSGFPDAPPWWWGPGEGLDRAERALRFRPLLEREQQLRLGHERLPLLRLAGDELRA